MLFAIVLIVALLGAKINGVVAAPWWVVVVSSIVLFIVGMITSGAIKFRYERIPRD